MVELWTSVESTGFSRAFTDFLDEFYVEPAQFALDQPPPADVPHEFRAFLAATVESLALDWGLVTPDWVWPEVLGEPICWEAFRNLIPKDSLATLLPVISKQTPTVFRQHGILVRANILSRF